MRKQIPPVKYLRECFTYDRLTGLLFWKKRPRLHFASDRECKRWNARYAGSAAFTFITPKGYRFGSIDKSTYFAHRVVWKLVTGKEPPIIMDHVNRSPADNRFENLRFASFSSNQINRTKVWSYSGLTGIRVSGKKWNARIHKDGKCFDLGTFATKELAFQARKQAEKDLYGEFMP